MKFASLINGAQPRCRKLFGVNSAAGFYSKNLSLIEEESMTQVPQKELEILSNKKKALGLALSQIEKQ